MIVPNRFSTDTTTSGSKKIYDRNNSFVQHQPVGDTAF